MASLMACVPAMLQRRVRLLVDLRQINSTESSGGWSRRELARLEDLRQQVMADLAEIDQTIAALKKHGSGA